LLNNLLLIAISWYVQLQRYTFFTGAIPAALHFNIPVHF
jgi:hypothetical protein